MISIDEKMMVVTHLISLDRSRDFGAKLLCTRFRLDYDYDESPIGAVGFMDYVPVRGIVYRFYFKDVGTTEIDMLTDTLMGPDYLMSLVAQLTVDHLPSAMGYLHRVSGPMPLIVDNPPAGAVGYIETVREQEVFYSYIFELEPETDRFQVEYSDDLEECPIIFYESNANSELRAGFVSEEVRVDTLVKRSLFYGIVERVMGMVGIDLNPFMYSQDFQMDEFGFELFVPPGCEGRLRSLLELLYGTYLSVDSSLVQFERVHICNAA